MQKENLIIKETEPVILESSRDPQQDKRPLLEAILWL